MNWIKYILHRHKWYYSGNFSDQYIFKCAICHKENKINVINKYSKEKINDIRKQMNESVSHLN
ncbi:hypothetical protein C8E03_11938 [Lachnotalea glycerini]|uniref:Uncharacterized protein n=1 Tax=Lachnotalea glycerini TaxID=1763509 RepID=A0A318ER44_9FIRM|nr:hypothetical protein [Lachnotalea glycerini]OYP41033.1 hypothetical protein CG709_05035 [Lachnotalea glycerini]PXV85114.1 hypothetical protein C8E03_11938 [Lachnotalea glycerini]